jgi:CCR4-NOT transcription complex subunit 6
MQESLQRLLGRDNVALLVVLRSVARAPASTPPLSDLLVVANTHVHWNPAMSDVKMMQIAFLLEHVRPYRHVCVEDSRVRA